MDIIWETCNIWTVKKYDFDNILQTIQFGWLVFSCKGQLENQHGEQIKEPRKIDNAAAWR